MYLNYSIEVMFNMTDKYGDIATALDKIGNDTREAFADVIWFAVNMANDGELMRRALGYEHGKIFKGDEPEFTHIYPLEAMELKNAVVNAINAGYVREETRGQEDVDIGLEKLNQKKTDLSPAAHG
jgi:hypothetical protein